MWHSCGIYVTRMLDVGIWDLWAVIWCIYVTCMLTYMLHKCVSYVKYMLNICDIYMTYLSHTAVCACMHIYICRLYLIQYYHFSAFCAFIIHACMQTAIHAHSLSSMLISAWEHFVSEAKKNTKIGTKYYVNYTYLFVPHANLLIHILIVFEVV